MSKEIQCQIVGRGTPSCLHDSVIYQPDFEGIQTPFQANEPVWRGGRSNRIVGNFAQWSNIPLGDNFDLTVFTLRAKICLTTHELYSDSYHTILSSQHSAAPWNGFLMVLDAVDTGQHIRFQFRQADEIHIDLVGPVYELFTEYLIEFYADGTNVSLFVDGVLYEEKPYNNTIFVTDTNYGISLNPRNFPGQIWDVDFNGTLIPINEGSGTAIHDSEGNIIATLNTPDVDAFWSGRVRNENGLTYSDDRDGVRLDPMPVLHYQDAAENVILFSTIDNSKNWGVITDFNISNMGPSKVFQAVNAWKHENINSEVGSRSRGTSYPVPINNNIVTIELVIENVNAIKTTFGLRNNTASNWVFSANFQWDTHLLEPYSGGEPDVMYAEEIFPDVWRLLIQKNVFEDFSTDELKFYIYPTGTNISNGQAITIHHVASYIDNDIEIIKKTGPIFTSGAAALTDRIVSSFDGANFSNQAMGLYCEVEPAEGLLIGKFLSYGLGPNLVVNGNFDNGDTGWSSNESFWSVIDGEAIFAGSGDPSNYQSNAISAIQAGKNYLIRGNVDFDGQYYFPIYGFDYAASEAFAGEVLKVMKATDNTSLCSVRASQNAINGMFDNFSIQEIGASTDFVLFDNQFNSVSMPGIVDQINRVGIVVQGNQMNINVNGTWAADTTYSGIIQDLSGMVELFLAGKKPSGIRELLIYNGGSFLELKGKIDKLML